MKMYTFGRFEVGREVYNSQCFLFILVHMKIFTDLRCQSVFAEGRIRPCRAYRVVKSIWSNIMLIRCRRQSNQLSDLSEYKTEVQTAETHILPQPCTLWGCPNPDVKPFSFCCLFLCFIFFFYLCESTSELQYRLPNRLPIQVQVSCF